MRPKDKVPTRKVITQWVKKFQSSSNTIKRSLGKPQKVRGQREIQKLWKSLNGSMQKHASALGGSQTSICCMLHEDVSMHPYKLCSCRSITKSIGSY